MKPTTIMSHRDHETHEIYGQIGAKFLDMKPTVETGAPAIIRDHA